MAERVHIEVTLHLTDEDDVGAVEATYDTGAEELPPLPIEGTLFVNYPDKLTMKLLGQLFAEMGYDTTETPQVQLVDKDVRLADAFALNGLVNFTVDSKGSVTLSQMPLIDQQ